MLSNNTEISFTSQIRVRFVETDPMGIVWHGTSIQYFEDGREAFGRHHGISYLDQKENGFTSPIVKSSSEHKRPLRFGEVATIKTIYIDSPAAKMVFRYEIFNEAKEVVCKGETTQVFLGNDDSLFIHLPPFFEKWKRKVGLLK